MNAHPLSLEQTHALLDILDAPTDELVREGLEEFVLIHGYDESTVDHFTYDHEIVSYTHRSLGIPKED